MKRFRELFFAFPQSFFRLLALGIFCDEPLIALAERGGSLLNLPFEIRVDLH